VQVIVRYLSFPVNIDNWGGKMEIEIANTILWALEQGINSYFCLLKGI